MPLLGFMSTNKYDVRWALVVLTLSGAASLGHQLLWTRRLADLIGATGDANARVFGCFFLGLSLGAAAASRLIPRLRRPWRTVALIELGIALLSLPALLVNLWSAPLWPALGPEKLSTWQGAWLKSLLSVVVVVPPAFLIGTTLPVLTAAICWTGKGVSRDGVWLYAAYTLGGALGIAAVVGFALDRLGASGSMLVMGGTNIAAGIVCLLRDRILPQATESPGPDATLDPVAEGSAPLRLLLLLSFFSGAGVLALEVVGVQLLNLKAPFTFYTPAAILVCVVLLLACSAASVASTTRFFKSPGSALIVVFALAGLAIAVAPLIFLGLTPGRSGISARGGSFAAALLKLGEVTCLSLGPAVLVAGMVFPLLISSTGSMNARPSQRIFAQMLAINGLGGLVGAEIGHRLLLPWLGVHLALGTVGASYGLVALALAITSKKSRLLPVLIPVGSLATTCLLLATSLKSAPIFLRSSTFNLLALRTGREGTLAIAERPDVGRAMFLDNHYMLGCTAGTPDMRRQAHLPLLLHRRPKQACFIGLGTGITAAAASQHGTVESIDVIELCPLVADAAARLFAGFNGDFGSDPKARVHVEDARTYIASARSQFDVIVGDLFTPWRPGEARLCSLEQFIAAKAALRTGGVFCQWLPLTQLTPEQFDVIAATFQEVFGEVHLFRNHLHNRSLPVALVGFKDASLDWELVARRCESERAKGLLRDPLCRHPAGLALLYLGTYRSGGKRAPRLNTLDNLQVELSAGRHLIAGEPADYFAATSDRWLAFVQAQSTRIETDHELPPALRPMPQVALSIARWEVAREAGDPASLELKRRWVSALPFAVLADPNADWSLWSGQDPRVADPPAERTLEGQSGVGL